jgi:hypothetical protein
MSFENKEAVMLGLGEAGAIPCLGKFLASEQRDFALPILRFFENREEYYPQLLSIGLANLARVSDECETLFSVLCHHASPAQLIPVFSFFLSQLLRHQDSPQMLSLIDSPTLDLTQVLPHLDVGKILYTLSGDGISRDLLERLYKILSSVYLRDSVTVIVADTHLTSWYSFLSQAPQDNLRLELICPILSKIITNCSDLKCFIDHGLLSSLFSRVHSHTGDNDFLRLLLDLIDHAVTVRAKESGGREKAMFFLDHLVSLEIFSFLTDSLNFKSRILQDCVFCVLKMLFRFDKKYQAHFKETPIMKLASSLLEDDRSEERGIDDLPRSRGENLQVEAGDQDAGVLKKRKREEEA